MDVNVSVKAQEIFCVYVFLKGYGPRPPKCLKDLFSLCLKCFLQISVHERGVL